MSWTDGCKHERISKKQDMRTRHGERIEVAMCVKCDMLYEVDERPPLLDRIRVALDDGSPRQVRTILSEARDRIVELEQLTPAT